MPPQYIEPAQIQALSSAYSTAALRIRELLGSLQPAASAVGPALGSANATTAYAGQWQQIQTAIGGAADNLEQFANALANAAGTYQEADARVGGPR